MKQIQASDGHKLYVYTAKPTGEIKGSIVVLQEIFGINRHIQSVADRFANDGFLAVAPALFDRVTPGIELGYTEAEIAQGIKLRQQLSWDKILLDVEAAYNLAKSQSDKGVAIVGYCFGGSATWRSATQLKLFQKAICYYGGEIYTHVDEQPNCPVIMHFGNKDTSITDQHVKLIEEAHPEIQVYKYDAGHAFNRDGSSNYDQKSAALAYQRTLEFLNKAT